MASPNEIKEEMKKRMKDTWSTAAGGYAEWVIGHHIMRGLFKPFCDLLVPALESKPGARIFDVASASGEPAATLAAALHSAHIVATDLVETFLELGRARDFKLGLTNITFEAADGEDLRQYPDSSFDAVTCCIGIMCMPSYDTALVEYRRVLKPGGILALTVWGAAQRVPFFQYARDLAAEYDPESVSPLASFTAMRFADPAPLLAAAREAGPQEVDCKELQVDFFLPQDLWWTGLLSIPIRLKAALVKAQSQRPGGDVYGEARQKMESLLAANGCFTTSGDLLCRDNAFWFITAKKAA